MEKNHQEKGETGRYRSDRCCSYRSDESVKDVTKKDGCACEDVNDVWSGERPSEIRVSTNSDCLLLLYESGQWACAKGGDDMGKRVYLN